MRWIHAVSVLVILASVGIYKSSMCTAILSSWKSSKLLQPFTQSARFASKASTRPKTNANIMTQVRYQIPNTAVMLEAEEGDLTTMRVDAIVNAANPSLRSGGGVDGAIHRKAGSKLLKECEKLNGCERGDAKITLGYRLPSKYVIHAVGPIYGTANHAELLKSAHMRSLELAFHVNENIVTKRDTEMRLTFQSPIRSIAFPAISTGVYGYPMEEAARIGLSAVVEFMQAHANDPPEYRIEHVVFVLFGRSAFDIYVKQMQNMFQR